MRQTGKHFLWTGIFMMMAVMAVSQTLWPKVGATTRPWTRWWWLGSAVDEKNITASLRQYHQAGFGGVEVVPIYGAKGFENRYIKYLSQQWMKILDHTVQQSNTLGMGVYISVGTGWPIGGTHVTVQDAASRLIAQSYELKANTPLNEKILVQDAKQVGFATLSVVMGFTKDNKAIDLTDKVSADGRLHYTAGEDLKLYALFTGKTKQLVKRAAPGGEGYTIDHFSRQATASYFTIFDTAFGNSSHGVKAFFNDSYEVYNANWTPDLFNEFTKRRGYDLKKYLPWLTSEAITDTIARLKSDYRETLASLMLENFSQVFTTWTNKRNTLSVNQAHGSPGNLLDLYGAFDIPETETYGSSYFAVKGLRRDSADIRNVDPDPVMLQFASSAAHVYGKPLTSCETFTWLSEHFKTAWSQCKPEVDQAFLSGINHVFFHGTTYSPAAVPWPGWLFYASLNVVPNNSLWPHVKGLNDYITRCQSVLQTGEPANEIWMYWPVYDVWHSAKGMDMQLAVHNIDEWLHPTAFYKNVKALQQAGYTLDFASDKMLQSAKVNNGQLGVTAKGSQYKVLIVPAAKKIPEATLRHIIRLAKEGATVIVEQWPEDVPGFYDLEKRRKDFANELAGIQFAAHQNGLQAATLGKGKIIKGDVATALRALQFQPESFVAANLQYICRKTGDAKYYFIVNHTANDIDETMVIQSSAQAVLLMDPLDGSIHHLPFEKGKGSSKLRLQLQSGESVILKFSSKKETAPVYVYRRKAGEAINLQNQEWQVHFKEGGPQLPQSRVLQNLQPWTNFKDDSAALSFSGTGVYSTTFNMQKKAADYLLKLDKLYESARIIINGKEAGLIWSLPFERRVGKYLKEGKNTIQVEVCNLMANRIRYMDRHNMAWRNYHEINFVNINYKPFDASAWKVQPSGLDGSLQLIPLQ